MYVQTNTESVQWLSFMHQYNELHTGVYCIR